MLTSTLQTANWLFIQKLAFRLFAIFFITYMLFNPNGGIPLPFFEKFFDLYIHIFERLAIWTNKTVLHSAQPLSLNGYGSGDTTLQYMFLLIAWSIAITGAIIWTIADRKRRNYNKALYWISVCVRYYLATTMVTYGFAKIFKIQFPAPSVQRLNETYGQSSPMGLAWTFFGYSVGYNYFMGFAELAGGLLLYFRRTATFGALITLSVSVNIMAVNYCFDVPVKILSTMLVAMCLFLLANQGKRLVDFFILNKATVPANIKAPQFKKWQNISLAVFKYLLIFQVVAGNAYSGFSGQRMMERYNSAQQVYGTYKVLSYKITKTNNDIAWAKLTIKTDSAFVTLATSKELKFAYNLGAESTQFVLFANGDPTPKYDFKYTPPKDDHLHLEMDGLSIDLNKSDNNSPLLIKRGFHWINEFPENK
jgi:hypothetical protein